MSSDDEEARPSSSKKKKQSKCNSSKRTCIIHVRSDVTGDVSCFKEKAWQVSLVPFVDSVFKSPKYSSWLA